MRLCKPNLSIAPHRGFNVPLKDSPTEMQLSRLLESRPSGVKVAQKNSKQVSSFFPSIHFWLIEKHFGHQWACLHVEQYFDAGCHFLKFSSSIVERVNENHWLLGCLALSLALLHHKVFVSLDGMGVSAWRKSPNMPAHLRHDASTTSSRLWLRVCCTRKCAQT